MKKLRVLIFLSTILIVGGIGLVATYFARGYRIDQKTLTLTPRGLLVANSDPTGAQVIINGDLKTATNATISLSPGIFDVTIKKEGFLPWNKRLTIDREIVTQIDVSLFSSAPSLSAITFAGAFSPSVSPDGTKVLYAVPESPGSEDKSGLWILETVNLPLGFNREPRRVTDGDMSHSSWEWSPDSREILLTTQSGLFLLNSAEFTPQAKRVNVSTQKEKIRNDWKDEKQKRQDAQLSRLPAEYQDIFKFKTSKLQFSPNENKILYTASSSANLKEGLIPQLPGSSTQKQTRQLKANKQYVYDIKEDRNFEIADATQPLYWFPTSHHLIVPEENKISIVDYDGTNKQIVYSGNYIFPHAYATNANNRLLILTSLGGSDGALTNLYSLGIK
jgi:dipeptidyl aminopeptidase/acylaminoacyl peptidase